MNLPFPLPDRYEPPTEAHVGGRGTVYVCKDRFLERKVVVKFVNDLQHLKELHNEFVSLSRIRSRHKPEIYEIVTSDSVGQFAIVEEHVSGSAFSSEAAIAANPMKSLWQLSRGIADVHEAHIAHRDLKPDNLRFDSEGVLKLLDFGFATDLDCASTIGARGTQGFRAPELYDIPPVGFTAAVDMYAFGVVAWFVLNNGELDGRFLELPPGDSSPLPTFDQAEMRLETELEQSLNLCLAINPDDRPSAKSITDLFERYLLFGRHKAFISTKSESTKLSGTGAEAALKYGSDSIRIRYDGHEFWVNAFTGDAFINNVRIVEPTKLPGSCVITLGARELAARRTFVTIDVSHPEVVV